MKKILLVEDEEAVAEFIFVYFSKKGITVDIAYDLDQGNEMFGPEYCLVILDVMMHGSTSFPLLARIKEENPKMPVFMFSSYDDEEFMDEAKRLGADGFVPKSMGLEYLEDFYLSKVKHLFDEESENKSEE